LTLKTYLIISVIITTFTGCSATDTKPLSHTPENIEASQQLSGSTVIIEEKALQLVKQMSNVLSSSPAFSFKALTVKEQVLPSNQKLQYDSNILVKMKRPNALFVEDLSSTKKKTIWYTGNQFSLLDSKNNFYGTLNTPDNIEDTLDFIMEKYSVNMPLADFVFKDLYSNLIKNVVSGFYVAKVEVNGIKTHHLAFHQNNLDWQLWIDAEGQMVPRKFVITYHNKVSSPQFTAFFKDWNLSPQFKTNEFSFKPPKDATKIDFYSELNR